ncbi:MAG: hypothetical protein QHH00_06240 [Methanomassiliicoccales archaeon]|nr:hypothetical protein [Methanomassiliicoccales archaeon]
MKLLSVEECVQGNLRRLVDGELSRIAIYTGRGASHSWIWLVDSLEKLGYYNLRFIREKDICSDMLADVLFISGGDTFGLADAIGPSRLHDLQEWIVRGGQYIGICAGAYLPLHSSLSPLNQFNLVKGKLSNITNNLDGQFYGDERFVTKYGSSYVFQPVRGPLVVEFLATEFTTHLYGGPCWCDVSDAEIMARYRSFTEKTIFLVSEEMASKTVIDKIAALRKSHGRGTLYLFGPHLEYPGNMVGNSLIGSVINYEAELRDQRHYSPEDFKPAEMQPVSRELRSCVSSARLMCFGMDGMEWRIGRKVWDSERFGYFFDAIWKRLRKATEIGLRIDCQDELIEGFEECISLMRQMRALKGGIQGSMRAEQLLTILASCSAHFFNCYFTSLRHHIAKEAKRTYQIH